MANLSASIIIIIFIIIIIILVEDEAGAYMCEYAQRRHRLHAKAP